MTATYTFDVFSTLDGYGSHNGDWGGYWGKQGPELLDRRLAVYDAEQRYRMVLEGRNPYASPGFGSTPDPYGQRLNTRGAGPSAPLTPQIAAQVEKDYRRWLASGGQIYQ